MVHGHAHRGIEHGLTPGGVHVRNVAQTVIRQGYAVYGFDEARRGDRVTTGAGAGSANAPEAPAPSDR